MTNGLRLRQFPLPATLMGRVDLERSATERLSGFRLDQRMAAMGVPRQSFTFRRGITRFFSGRNKLVS
jgi:hypothetical protein